MSDLISIVIPMYNAKATIKYCIESVKNQTYKNIELLIVDDKSSDNSIQVATEVCQSLEFSYQIIENNTNMGVSATRNKGIDLAKGTYILFIDADDMISSNFVNDLYNAVKDGKYDMPVCDYDVITNIENIEINAAKDTKLTSITNKIDVLKQHGYAWGILYRKEVLMKNQIRFEETINYMEDVLFTIEYLTYVDNIVLVPSAIYYYVKTSNSLSRLGNPVLTAEKTYKVTLEADKMLAEASVEKFLHYIYARRFVRNCYFGELQKIGFRQHYNIIKKLGKGKGLKIKSLAIKAKPAYMLFELCCRGFLEIIIYKLLFFLKNIKN